MELGYFSLRELETAKQGLRGLKALPIEQDISFKPCAGSQRSKKLHSDS
jgi:hypothetical protein